MNMLLFLIFLICVVQINAITGIVDQLKDVIKCSCPTSKTQCEAMDGKRWIADATLIKPVPDLGGGLIPEKRVRSLDKRCSCAPPGGKCCDVLRCPRIACRYGSIPQTDEKTKCPLCSKCREKPIISCTCPLGETACKADNTRYWVAKTLKPSESPVKRSVEGNDKRCSCALDPTGFCCEKKACPTIKCVGNSVTLKDKNGCNQCPTCVAGPIVDCKCPKNPTKTECEADGGTWHPNPINVKPVPDLKPDVEFNPELKPDVEFNPELKPELKKDLPTGVVPAPNNGQLRKRCSCAAPSGKCCPACPSVTCGSPSLMNEDSNGCKCPACSAEDNAPKQEETTPPPAVDIPDLEAEEKKKEEAEEKPDVPVPGNELIDNEVDSAVDQVEANNVSADSEAESDNLGVIIGATVGGVLCLLGIAIIAFTINRNNAAKQQQPPPAQSRAAAPLPPGAAGGSINGSVSPVYGSSASLQSQESDSVYRPLGSW